MKLTKNFELEEFLISQTAIRNGIINTPNSDVTKNIKDLCVNVLQPLRNKLKQPILITSGYRSDKLNRIIGGANDSQHIVGEAADIIVPGMQACELFAFILTTNIKYDQIILEFNRWVHISYKQRSNRHRVLLAKRIENEIIYEEVFGTA